MGSNPTVSRDDDRMIEKLDHMLKLLGMMAVKGISQTEQIATLSRIGLSPKDIADVLGTTANTVRVSLVSIRKTGGHKNKRLITDK